VNRSKTSLPISGPSRPVNVEIVEDQVDGPRFGMTQSEFEGHFANSKPERSGVAKVKWRPAFGSTAQKTLAVPLRLYSLSRRASRPGLAGEEGRTSACSVTGFSSRQTTGCSGS